MAVQSTLQQRTVGEWEVRSAQRYPTPFADVVVEATFTGPDGRSRQDAGLSCGQRHLEGALQSRHRRSLDLSHRFASGEPGAGCGWSLRRDAARSPRVPPGDAGSRVRLHLRERRSRLSLRRHGLQPFRHGPLRRRRRGLPASAQAAGLQHPAHPRAGEPVPSSRRLQRLADATHLGLGRQRAGADVRPLQSRLLRHGRSRRPALRGPRHRHRDDHGGLGLRVPVQSSRALHGGMGRALDALSHRPLRRLQLPLRLDAVERVRVLPGRNLHPQACGRPLGHSHRPLDQGHGTAWPCRRHAQRAAHAAVRRAVQGRPRGCRCDLLPGLGDARRGAGLACRRHRGADPGRPGGLARRRRVRRMGLRAQPVLRAQAAQPRVLRPQPYPPRRLARRVLRHGHHHRLRELLGAVDGPGRGPARPRRSPPPPALHDRARAIGKAQAGPGTAARERPARPRAVRAGHGRARCRRGLPAGRRRHPARPAGPACRARWFDPRTGALEDAAAGSDAAFQSPQTSSEAQRPDDWVLLVDQA